MRLYSARAENQPELLILRSELNYYFDVARQSGKPLVMKLFMEDSLDEKDEAEKKILVQKKAVLPGWGQS